jgi:hypothetical protein
MTRSVDRIAAGQEQIARTVDRLTAGQEQMTREITKLQGIAQYALYNSSEPPPRPALAPARNPIPRSSQAPTVRSPPDRIGRTHHCRHIVESVGSSLPLLVSSETARFSAFASR